MPSTAISSSAWYSPCPASRGAIPRHDEQHARRQRAGARRRSVSASVRSSIASAPETTQLVVAPLPRRASPTAAPSVTSVSSGTSDVAHERARAAGPPSARCTRPPVSATSGEIAAQSICGP